MKSIIIADASSSEQPKWAMARQCLGEAKADGSVAQKATDPKPVNIDRLGYNLSAYNRFFHTRWYLRYTVVWSAFHLNLIDHSVTIGISGPAGSHFYKIVNTVSV
jgi:hypothetical protein